MTKLCASEDLRAWRALGRKTRRVIVPPAPASKARLVQTRVLRITPFGAEVEHADPRLAAYDASPFNGGRYPRSPRPVGSFCGSPALMCAEG